MAKKTKGAKPKGKGKKGKGGKGKAGDEEKPRRKMGAGMRALRLSQQSAKLRRAGKPVVTATYVAHAFRKYAQGSMVTCKARRLAHNILDQALLIVTDLANQHAHRCGNKTVSPEQFEFAIGAYEYFRPPPVRIHHG